MPNWLPVGAIFGTQTPVRTTPEPSHSHSDALAGCLGLFLGPVGLWYKGQWLAGFAWLAMAILVVAGSGGLGIVFAPVFWFGMCIHAIVAKPAN